MGVVSAVLAVSATAVSADGDHSSVRRTTRHLDPRLNREELGVGEFAASLAEFRDHAFETTNGSVTGARRIGGRGDLWEIAVQPDWDADVVVELPKTKDCNAQGAVCTAAGAKLSTRLELRVGGPGGRGQAQGQGERVYTYEDGDRTIRVILQGDLVVEETGADTPTDRVTRRVAGGNIVRRQDARGAAGLPVFRSASGGALMTLPGGVLLALDPEWDEAGVNGFFARNNISKARISELDYIPNGFFVRTEPGFPSLELANALAAQKGVVVSSPNWWREIEARQDPEETKGDDRGATKEAGGIEPRNAGFNQAYDLPLDGSYSERISPATDIDYFRLDLSGQTGDTDVRIYTISAFDTVGGLYDSNRGFLMGNDDSFGTFNFSLLASLSPGVYYVSVYSYEQRSTGSYTLHSETVTATSVSLGSSVAASIGAAGEVDYFKLDLSDQTGTTDVSVFTVSDNLALEIESPESWTRWSNPDALGDIRSIFHLSGASLSPGVYLGGVWSPDGGTGDYTLRAAAVPDHGSTTAAATDLSLDAPTSGKITSASDADYFELKLTAAKDLVIMAFPYVTAVMLDSGSTEIPVNVEIPVDGDNRIIDDFAAGTYYVKITAPDASSSAPVDYALYAYEDTGYGTWVDGCADDTNDLGSSTINDPLYACQWHLNSADSADMDINVESVWADSITGEGVNVAVVDDTIDYSHDDLSANINSSLNHDYGGLGNAYRPADHHGTNVAGVIASRDNAIGVRGVAPRATIYGYNILADGNVHSTYANKADAMARNPVETAVSSNSWGPPDRYRLDHAPATWEMAIDSGVTEGYAGKGVFYAWAGGNGHLRQDNSNFDEFANYYGVTAVCAVSDAGIRSSYSEQGANLWVCAPSSGGDRSIVTTENSDRYTNDFSGTSSATPKVSGVAALLRQANPDLTWRDLKLILAASARQNDSSNARWEEGARKYGSADDADRYHFNHEYGFGVVDAAAAVALARDWNNLPEFQNASSASGTLNRTIPDGTVSSISHSVSLDTDIEFTEFVAVEVSIDHEYWRDLRIELISPAGTDSTLGVPMDYSRLDPTEAGTSSPGTFRFGSAKHLGENPDGVWTLRVTDEASPDQGTLESWSITVYGHRGPAPDLVVESPTVSASNPTAGSSFTLSATVRNRGSGAAASSTLRYYRSSDATISTSDTSVGTDSVGGLAAGSTSAESISVSAPSSGGTYYYGACVGAVTDESDTANNCSTAVRVTVVGPPDLVVDPPTVSDTSPLTGESFTLRATVRNRGSGAAGSSTLRYYRSSDDTISTSDTSVGTDSVSSLAAGSTSAESFTVSAPSSAGTYYYGACVGAVTDESDITNNCSAAVRVTVVAPPDLVVESPAVSSSNPTAGASFTLSATVRNRGSGAAASSTLRYYRSSNATISISDTSVGTDSVSSLDAGSTSAESISVSAPSSAGIYYYGACVGAVTDESDITNNCSVAVRVTVGTAPAPDLVVGAPAVSSSNPTAGESFTLSATVRNRGSGAAASSTLRYYRSSDATISISDTSVGTDLVSSLAAGSTSAESISVTAPSSAGTYYYGACVGAVTDESDTANNCSAAVRLAVGAPAPDLVVGAPTVSDTSLLTGESFTLSATVRNRGSATAARSTLRYYRSRSATLFTSDTSVGTDSVGGLDAGSTSAESISVTASGAGIYYYGACVGAVTDESDTTNNCSAAVRVTEARPPPDLVVDPPTVYPSSPLTGESFTLSATVRNRGRATAASSTLRYYRSSDPTISIYDTSVGTDSVGALAAGSTSAESISVTAPSKAGTYYYGACVDAVTDESDTANCSPSVWVTVVAPAPDLVVEWPTVSDTSPLTGESFTLSATVRNRGSGAAASSTLRYYRSSGPIIHGTIFSNDTSVGTDSVGGLAAGSTSAESISVSASPGIYYYGACVGAVTDESDTTNNCSVAVRVTVGSVVPDLVVDPPAVSSSSPLTGESFTLSATVRNRGSATAASSTLRYYRSSDPIIWGDIRRSMPRFWKALRYYRSSDPIISRYDASVGTDSVSSLAAGSTSAESISVSAPASAGIYYYGACVGAVTDESDRTNNCSVAVRVTVGSVLDLVVDPPAVSSSNPTAGESFTLSATVRNRGSATATSSTLRYYRSSWSDAAIIYGTIYASDNFVGTDPVSSLDAGSTSAESISVSARINSSARRTTTYYYGACVDAVADESDTTNNCSATVRVTVGAPAPDLVVGAPAVSSSSPLTGESFTLSATVRNRGSGAAASSPLRYYRSSDPTISIYDASVGTDSVGALDAGSTSAESISVSAPSSAGTDYYGACVGAVTDESDTTNNCSAAVRVTVTAPPDLVVESPAVSDTSPLTGESFTLSATVRNQGSGAAASSTLRYYRSSDATISISDTSVGTDSVGGLAAGSTSAESISVSAPSSAGTYYYGACVGAVTDESDTANNCSAAVRVTVVAPPDLVVESPTVTVSSPLTGESFTLSATVRNRGSGAAGSSTLRYYRSSDATISTSDTSVGTDSVGGLAAGSTSAESISVSAPSSAGTYYYGACVGAVTDESDTTNNCSAAVRVTVAAPPDLVVESPAVSASNPTAGTSFTLSATVRNNGGSAAGATTLRYYRSSDASISASDTSVGTDSVGGLAAGSTSAESISVSAPSSAGTYYYGACVGAVTDESDTANNCSAAVRVTVVAPPDLVVESPTVTVSSPLTGESFTLSATVRNRGSGAAGSSTLRYYRSSDATISISDTSVGTDSVGGLAAGSTSAESISVSAPASAGTYYYGACVGAVTNESDTTNNCSTAVRVTVTAPPDLVVESPTVSASNPTAGSSFTLSATVRNRGSGAAASSTLRYYRSSDATISTSDTSVGTDSVGGLAAGSTSAESISVSAPSSGGTYYYGACVGAVTDESDTANNCSAAVRVTVAAPPDLVVESPAVSSSSPLTGESFTLRATVRNRGSGAAGSSTLRYYRSSDDTISTSDTSVGTDSVGGLAAGSTSAESVSVTAPASAGTYYYGACVGAVTDESDTANNCSTAVRVTVAAPPDLVVDAPAVSASNPTAGTSFTLRATVRNNGGRAAGATTLRYYRSSDDTISTSDTSVGTDSVGGLAAGSTSAESISVSAPSSAGTYYYGACVGAVTDESDTTNNCSAAVRVTVAAPPDLVVDPPAVSASNPTAGTSFTLSATVRNNGGSAAGATTLRYYRSSDATISTSDTSVGTDVVGGLAAGSTSAESISVSAPASAGTYYYGACVGAVTDESDTANNCSAAVAVTVAAPPDLVVGAPTVSSSNPTAGTSFTLSATVRNNGGSAAGATTLRYYRSSDATISISDTSVGTDSVSSLAAGSTSAESISVTAPSSAGTYYYGACVGAVTDESDTANNCSAAVRVTVVAPPDLVVESPAVSDTSPLTGASFTLSATVRNRGSGAAASSTLRYYRSSDATISTSDTSVGTDSVGGLAAGSTSAESISVSAPASAGTYYYGACVGAVTDESDTANNCSAAVRVTVVAPPDLVVESPAVSSSSPLTGASFTLSATVRNRGSGAAASSTLRYYRSSDDTISTSDTSVGTDSVSSLDAGSTSAESISVSAPSSAGTYYYGACVGAVTDESDTTNNCSAAVRVTVAAPPDLVVGAPAVSSSNPTAGTSFTLRATVRNNGGSAAGATTLRYYRSSDATISTSDTSVGTDSVGGLAAGSTSAESISVSAPASAGTYYYGACVGAVTDESDTANNCSAAVAVTVGAATAPDLVVGAPAVSDTSPLTGESFTLRATVRNQGSAAAASSTLRYYRSSDDTISTSDTSVGTDSVSSLAAGSTSAESVSVSAPSSAGTYYYGACVGAVTNESDTTNNCSTAVRVTVTAPPDLVVGAPTVSDTSPLTGASFTLSATVRNRGSGAAGSSTLRYYRSSDDTISTSDTSVGTDSVSSLDAGSTSAESVSVTAPSSAGTYYYGACVGAVTDESDTTNNCSTAVRVTVAAPPDLVVGAPTVSDTSPLTGASFTLSATVRNRGSGAAGSSTLRYYRSSDDTISTSDTSVGTDSVSSLAAGSTSAESISVTAPSSAGTYYYGACVGAVTDESDTTNNCSTAVRVTVAAPPDLVVDAPAVSASNPTAGTSFTLRATVRNNGGSAAGATTLRYYRSSDDTISTSDTSVGTDSVSSLDAGSTSAESVSVTAPSSAGTYYYGACVDSVTDESDTANNCSTAVAVTVGAATAPDLVVGAPAVSDTSPLTGESFTLSATVRNRGSAAAASSTLRYYRSSDDTISTSDTSVGTDSVSSLDAGSTSAESVSVTAPTSAGTYYYGACVGAVTNESDTTNNCSTAVRVTVTAATAPDLVVDPPTVSPSSPLTGASFTLSATVRNQGTAASTLAQLRYYRSSDDTISTSDTSVGTDSVSSLDAGSTSAESISVTAPASAGTYYYGACVGAVTNESDTTNNCSAAVRVTVAEPPDLVVDPPTVSPSSPLTGASFTLSATVRNSGGSAAGGSTLRYYRSSDASISASDTSVGTDSVGGLAAGASSGESISVTAPASAGTYYYGACVGAVTNESDTTNNCSAAVAVTVGTAPAPDLVVESPSVTDSSPLTGASFTLSVRVRNLGSAAAGSSTLRYYRSSDATISTSDTPETSTAAVGVLDAGASITQLIPLTAPATTGTYYYGACVDTLTNESDTANNCSAAVRVTVGAAPVFTDGANTERRVAENRAAGTNVGSAVRATDADNDTLTYSLEGTDEASFSIVSARGQIRTVAALDHETSSSYSVRVKADDGKGGTATIEVIITVTDVNEPPTVHGENLVTIFENEDLIASYSAIDPEGPATTFTWSVTGTDRGDFNIGRNTGDLTFRNTPDFERPADSDRNNEYLVTVRATDEGGLRGSLDVTVTVNDVNEPPTITTTGSSAVALRQNENVTSRLYSYRATDPEGADTVIWSVGGADARFFTIDGGQFSFKEDSAPDYEEPADSDGDNVYNVVVQATDDGNNTAPLAVTVTVTDVNEGPEVTGGQSSFTISENQDLPDAVYTGFDPEGGTVTRWSVGGRDGGDFTISQGGVLTFRSLPDYERPADSDRDNIYELQVRPYDGRHYGSFDVTVTVNDVNEPPTITTAGSSAVALRQNENRISRLYSYRATDPEGAGTVTWSVGGADAGFFAIDGGGQFSFKEDSAPDYEEPADSDGDNVYNVVVQATDDGNNTAPLDVTVTVTDVNEGPEISRAGSAPVSVPENQPATQVLARYTATDPEGGTVSRWRTSGSDGGDFVINEQGELRFRNTPDYERPADSGRDNVYVFTVQATDGRNYGSFEETVTVTPVNEPPAITTAGSSAVALRQNENVTSRLYTYRATDPEGADTVTWSVGGVDKDFFTIDERGQFSFKEDSPPDFEDPGTRGRTTCTTWWCRPRTTAATSTRWT